MPELAKHPYLGYKLYLTINENRRIALLVKIENYKYRKTTSYARYLMEVKLGRFLTADEQVDHKNDNSMDDSEENLQILTPIDNLKKSNPRKPMPIFICPVCGVKFQQTRRQSLKRTPCCSRSCGGVRSIQTLVKRKSLQ